MDNRSAHQTLADRYQAMAADGLVDVKFLLSNTSETTVDEVCDEVNAMYAALERGDYKALTFSDGTIQ